MTSSPWNRLVVRTGTAVAVITLFGWVSHAAAQDPEPIEGLELSPRLVEIPSIGMTMQMPLATQVTLDPNTARRIVAVPKDRSWVVEISVIHTATDDISISDLAEGTIKTAQSDSVTSEVASRERRIINDQPADQIVIHLMRANGSEEVRMHTIFKPSPKTFAIHTLHCGTVQAKTVVPAIKVSVDTIRFSGGNRGRA